MANYTMKDIAKMAGVSVATVGRVIHQNGYVSDQNKKKIEKIIDQTGFVPNKIASGLKKRKSKLIGHMTVFSINMQFEKISVAINQAASDQGYHVLTLTSYGSGEEEARQIDELIGQQVEGIIITSNAFIDPKLIKKIITAKIPLVMIERTLDLDGVDTIVVDDYQGTFQAVSHFINRGHERIGYIGLKPLLEVEKQRYNGYVEALRHDHLLINEDHIYLCDEYSVNEGKKGAQYILNKENRPTGIFAASDVLASGVLQYCYKHSLSVPNDISLIGYDNTVATLLSPPITSVALPEIIIGDEAIRLLLERLDNKSKPKEEIKIQPSLVERDTVSKL